MRDYLRKVSAYEKAAKKAGKFDESSEEWAEEQFEFYGMRAHMLMMRGGKDGQIDQQQYRDAIKHREKMEPLVDPGYIGTGWTFIGPRALDGVTSCQNGPVTGRVNTVAYNKLDGNDWWLGGGTGGVFKTADNGATFSGESDTWDTTYVSKIAIDPTNANRVYVATGDYPGWWGYGLGIMRTSDGTSWTNELVTELDGCEVSDIVVDPDDTSTIIATAGRGTGSSNGAGIWRSTDYGNTWTRVVSTFATNGYSKLSVGVKVSGIRYIYASGGVSGIIRRSSDGGATWQNANLPSFDFCAVAASKTARDLVYAYSAAGAIYMSADNGDNWISITGNLGNITAAGADFRQTTYNYLFDVINTAANGSGSDILMFGAVDLFTIVNPIGGNRTWKWINGDPGETRIIHADYHGFDQHPTNKATALIANDGGVWQMTYSAGSYIWINKNAALRLTEHVFTAPHPDASNNPNYLLTGMWHIGCGFSPNDVNDWRSVHGGDGMWTAIDDANPLIQYTSDQRGEDRTVIDLRGTSNAWATSASFSTNTAFVDEDFAFASPWDEIPGDTGALYLAGERLYKFKWTGGNATWTKSIGGADFSSVVGEYVTALEAVTGAGCFVGTNAGRLQGSLTPTTGMPLILDFSGGISSINASSSDPDDLLISIGGVDRGPGNGGALWEVLDATDGSPNAVDRTGTGSNSLPNVGVNWIERDPYDPTSTWYAATDLGVFYTRNRGADWYNISESFGLPNALVYQLESSDNYLYASTFGRGVWRMTLYSSAPVLTAFTFQQTEVTGGNSAPATMTLSREAPPGGLDIPVTSNNLAVIKSQSVHFPAGRTSATVYVDTEIVTGDANVTVTANYGGPVSDSILVRECKVIDLQLSNVTSGDGFTGLVIIDRPAPGGGLTINLADNDPGTTVQTPVTILAGATGAFFNVTTTMVPNDVLVGVQASGPGSGWQESFTKFGVRMTDAFFFPPAVWNTQTGQLIVTLNRNAPSNGFHVVIDSGIPSVALAPPSATVPGGTSSLIVPVQTFYVQTTTQCGFRVWDPYQGFLEPTLNVKHLGIQSLTFNPNPVIGGNPSTGTLTLDNNIGLSSFTVNLSSLYTAFAQVPATVTVPNNQASVTFQATTFGVNVVNDIPITAQIGTQQVAGSFLTTNLRLLPSVMTVVPSSFTVNLGKLNAGNLASLAGDDADVFRVCKFLVPNLFIPPVTVQLDGTAPVGVCSALKLHVKSRMQHAGSFSQQLELFNWVTNTWDTTDTRTDVTNLSFVVRELSGTGSLARLLRSDGALRARYRVKQTGPSAVIAWCHEVDQAVWILNP